MAYYIDLSPCDYFDVPEQIVRGGPNPREIRAIKWADRLRAIGWLDDTHSYTCGRIPPAVRAKLGDLNRDPWEPCLFFGWHTCELCSFADADRGPRGIRNIFVPGNGFLYVAPEMILHYIERHDYLPPTEFCDAVLACPHPGSASYLEMVKSIVPREVLQVFG
jgi:hypothetical protein